jgi:excisionase family DNA binding protein
MNHTADTRHEQHESHRKRRTQKADSEGRKDVLKRLVGAMDDVTVKTERDAWSTEASLASWLRISDRKVRMWVAEGRLPSYKLDGCRRFHPDDVDEFVSQFRCVGRAAA